MIEVFSIAPAPPKSLGFLALIGLVLLGIILLFGYFAYSSRLTRFEIAPEGLAIRGTMYGRVLPWSDLHVEEARVVDLASAQELQPTSRTNGLGLPGYQAGWFRLRRAGRGLLFVTDRSRVVVVPTGLGYTLLLSPAEPERFVRALRQAAGS